MIATRLDRKYPRRGYIYHRNGTMRVNRKTRFFEGDEISRFGWSVTIRQYVNHRKNVRINCAGTFTSAVKMTVEWSGERWRRKRRKERVKSGLLAEDCKGWPLLSFQIISSHYSSKTSTIKRGQTDPATAAWLLKAT